nr:AMP-binding protein [Rhodococcus sp. (in: high G+C Gram-positive bacteria)]
MLSPVSPSAAAHIVRGVWRHGASVATLFAIAAARFPDRAAIIDDDGPICYAELYRQSIALAHNLGTGTDGHPNSVAVLCRNHRGFVLGVAAAGQTGAEIISINTELPDAQLAAVLDRHAPDVLLYDDEYTDAVRSSGFAGHAICVDSSDAHDGRSLGSTIASAATTNPRRVWKTGKFTLLTSGTTGLAKGVPRSIKPWGIAQLAATGCARIGMRSNDVVLVCPPFFHGFGIAALLGGVTAGATVVCHRRFDPAVVAEDLVRHRVTVLYAVPAMVQRLLGISAARGGSSTHSLRIAVTGAAPITGTTVRRFHDAFGPILVNGYGSTEAGVVSLATVSDLVDAPSTVGTAALGVSIRITADDGASLPVGQTGRILVRGPLEYRGYTPDENSLTAAKLVVDRHVDTGDIGHLDDAGRLFLAGRSDDMIVSGGENVFPGEVEEVVASHPAVTDVVVLGVADDEFGQVLQAFVVLTTDVELDADDLKAHVRQRLERYKVPKRFIVIDQIPRNASGKVLRRNLDDAADTRQRLSGRGDRRSTVGE